MDFNVCPFPSRRSPVISANGIVATSQPLASQVGLQVLRDGGNAVDAALATAMALTVLEPTSNGIGSDAFALVWDGARLHGINASGRWPGGFSAQSLRDAGHDHMPQLGWPAVTVPGCVAMWADLSERIYKFLDNITLAQFVDRPGIPELSLQRDKMIGRFVLARKQAEAISQGRM